MTEAEYDCVTYQLAKVAAETLARVNQQKTFDFVSGAGADSSEKSSTMGARVKGKTENAILHLPFKADCVFRPVAVVAMMILAAKYGPPKPVLESADVGALARR